MSANKTTPDQQPLIETPAKSAPDGVETFNAKVRRVKFSKAGSDFAILELDRLDRSEAVIAVGSLAAFHTGERLSLTGRFERHATFGLQLRVQSAYTLAPDTKEAIEEYLVGAKIKGIGPAMAKKIVKTFGAEALKVIHEQPERLTEISGLGEAKREALREAVKGHAGQRDVMVFLHQLNLGAALAGRIWSVYGDATIERVKENPYQLIREVELMTFQRADQLARLLDWPPDSLERAEALLEHLLVGATEEGHVCLPRGPLLERAVHMMGNAERVQEAFERSLRRGALLLEERFMEPEGLGISAEPFVYLPWMAQYEDDAALQTKAMSRLKRAALPLSWEVIEGSLGVQLAETQREAVERAAQEGVLLLTGGPGTGKTTTLKALITLFEHHKQKVLLAAPTGRAARRITETSGREAMTLHRLLDYNPLDQTFRRDAQHQLEGDVLIVDEASMIDLKLYSALLKATPAQARLILVGDMNQLPSVGAGRVYHDLLQSNALPTIRLTEVFRQAQQSQIVTNAYQVLKGEPLLPPPEGPEPSDLYHFAVSSGAEARELIERMVLKEIPERFSIPSHEIQVLTPMYRGACGADALNASLQDLLNPSGKVIKGPPPLKGERSPRVGDKVMQLKNLYDKEVFNGDIGELSTALSDGALVDFEGRFVQYSRDELKTLTLAYACSIHKSQGSEYPAVVIPVLDEHSIMLERDLLYTAITRAQRLVVIVSQASAIRRAICTLNSHHRFGHLQQRLEVS